MQTGYWYTPSRHFDRLDDADSVGRRRPSARCDGSARARSKPRACRSSSIPTWRRGCCARWSGAASGPSLYKGASFLVGRLGTEVASAGVTIHRRRHDARRAGFEAVRRRRSADQSQERGRARRAQDLSARLLLRAQARSWHRPATPRARSATRPRSARRISTWSPAPTRPRRLSARSSRVSI